MRIHLHEKDPTQTKTNEKGMEKFFFLTVTTVTLCTLNAFRLENMGTISRDPHIYENILRPEYGVNYKFNGILHHNLDRVWVILKIPMPDYLGTNTVNATMARGMEDKDFNCEYWTKPPRGKHNFDDCNVCSDMSIAMNVRCVETKSEWERIKVKNRALLKELDEKLEDITAALPEMYEIAPKAGPGLSANGFDRKKREAEMYPQLNRELYPQDAEEPNNEDHKDGTEEWPRWKEDMKGWNKGTNTTEAENREKRGIFSAILGGIITIASETVNHFIKKKRDRATRRALQRIEENDKDVKNTLRQLEDEKIMYGEYTIENMQAVYDALMKQHTAMEVAKDNMKKATENAYWKSRTEAINKRGKVYADQAAFKTRYRTLMELARDRYVERVRELTREAETLLKALETLAKGRLPHEIITHSRMKDMINKVENMLYKNHGNYRVALDSTDQYYDMKLATFSVDKRTRSLIIAFPIFIKQATLKPFSLYEIETVPVPIEDEDKNLNSYTEVVFAKPYIANNEEYYIQLRIPELRMCKIIDHMYFCEEIFLMKHRTRHSCESTILHNLGRKFVKENCDFKLYYNKTVVPAVLDGGDTIVLANFDSRKRLNCEKNHNLDTPMTLEHHQYQVINRSILCDCKIEANMISVLKSASACTEKNSKIPPLLFTLNKGFNLFLEEFAKGAEETGKLKETNQQINKKMIETIEHTISDQKQVIPMKMPDIRDPTTGERPETMKAMLKSLERLKEHQKKVKEQTNQRRKEEKDLKLTRELEILDSAPVRLFEFITSTLGACLFGWVVFKWCKKYKTSMTAPGLMTYQFVRNAEAFEDTLAQSMKQAAAEGQNTAGQIQQMLRNATEAVGLQEAWIQSTTQPTTTIHGTCKTSTLSLILIAVPVITAAIWFIRTMWKMKWLKGEILEDTCEIQLWIWSGIRYAPIPILKLPGHCTLFSRDGYLDRLDVDLENRCTNDILHISWQNCVVLYRGTELSLPTRVRIPMKDKLRVRRLMGNGIYMRVNVMLKSGRNWYQLPKGIGPRPRWNEDTTETQEESTTGSSESNTMDSTPRDQRKQFHIPPDVPKMV